MEFADLPAPSGRANDELDQDPKGKRRKKGAQPHSPDPQAAAHSPANGHGAATNGVENGEAAGPGPGSQAAAAAAPRERHSLRSGAIAVTQPRRVAAMTVARRVAEEMGCELGAEVRWAGLGWAGGRCRV